LFMSLVGGASFPGQAIVFAKVARAFELPKDEARSEGDFWSLMFFVIALGNLVAYAAIGWGSNTVIQVSLPATYINASSRLIQHLSMLLVHIA